jgi:hypothetical protein
VKVSTDLGVPLARPRREEVAGTVIVDDLGGDQIRWLDSMSLAELLKRS